MLFFREALAGLVQNGVGWGAEAPGLVLINQIYTTAVVLIAVW